jgi:transposase InsO family protein
VGDERRASRDRAYASSRPIARAMSLGEAPIASSDRTRRSIETVASPVSILATRDWLECTKRRPDHPLTREYDSEKLAWRLILNAFIESSNGLLRDECLNVHQFVSLDDVRRKIETWRHDYNDDRPHSSLGT